MVQVAINLLGLPQKNKCYIESELRRKEELLRAFDVRIQLSLKAVDGKVLLCSKQHQTNDIMDLRLIINVDGDRQQYLLSNLLRTRILTIHMVF